MSFGVVSVGSETGGLYAYRSWSGGDRSLPPRPPKQPVFLGFRDRILKVPYTDRKGRPKYRRVKITSEVVKWRRNYPPRRATRDEFHSYEMNGYRFYAEKVHWGTDSSLPGVYFNYSNDPFRLLDDFADPWDANDQLKLIASLATRITGSSFNASIFLAEGNQALEMIFNAATRINNMYSSLRKGDAYSAVSYIVTGHKRGVLSARDLRAVRKVDVHLARKGYSGAVLEIQYGWKPLLNDVYDGAQSLAHRLNTPMQFRVTSTVQSRRAPFGTKRQFSAAGNPDYWKFDGRVSSSSRIIAVFSEADPWTLQGLDDPAQMAWEKLPWSFVADWFIPIGTWLSARAVSKSLKDARFCITHRVQVSSSVQKTVGSPSPTFSLVPKESPSFYYRRTSINRVVTDDLDVAFPSFKPLGQVPSWQRATNAVALLVQRSDTMKRL